MGLFDKLFKRGKYPDSRMRKGARMGRVYAGPEQMRKRYEHKEEEPVIEDVYAGPDMFDEPVEQDVTAIGEETKEEEINEAETGEAETDAVETDDEETNEAVPDDAVSGDTSKPPRPEPDMANMMAVYAGPEQMSQPQVMFVYAGPMQMQKRSGGFMKLEPNMMMAYAGPNTRPGSMTEVMNAPSEEKPREVNPGTCPCCGSQIDLNGKFCPECGYMLQQKKPNDGTELC